MGGGTKQSPDAISSGYIGSQLCTTHSVRNDGSGSAFLAGLGVGFWKNTDAISRAWAEDRRFEADMPSAERNAHLTAWKTAVSKA